MQQMLSRMILVFGALALCALSTGVSAVTPAPVVTIDGQNIFPESVTALDDGTMIVGSMVTPAIYRALPGQALARPWIHLDGEHIGTSWGVLADPAGGQLWACVVEHPANTPQPPPMSARHSSLRVFDLATGAQKGRYPLPGPTNGCNDITIGPDRTVYVSDPPNGRILKLKPDGGFDVLSQDPQLAGVDGIAFVGGTLYANTVSTGHLFRVPLDAAGNAGALVDIKLSQPLSGPDGMRALGRRLYVAENRSSQVSVLDFDGDSAKVTVIKTGFQTSTGVAPTRDTLWVEESKQNFWRDPALANTSPNPFVIYALPLPR